MILFKKFAIFLLFFVLNIFQVYTQTLPSRIELPNWLKMGMSLNEIRNNIQPNTLLQPGGSEDGNFYSYRTNDNDWHRFLIDPKKGLTSFQISTNYYNVMSIIDNIIEIYGFPFGIENNEITWVHEYPILNIIAIKIYNFDNFFIIQYYFENYME